MKAIIVGAGIGGLTAALSLQRIGWDVQVLEQAQALGDVGAGIQISPNASQILRALGVLDALDASAFRPENLEMRWGRSGKSVFTLPLREVAPQRWGAPYLHLHRADLIAVLAAALEQRSPSAVQMATSVTGYAQSANQVHVLTSDGRSIAADVVVAADGIHSAIQAQMLGPTEPRYTGNVAWRAVVPIEALGDLAPPPNACVWVGAGRHAVTYRLRGGTLANFVGVVEQEQGWHQESWTQRGRRDDVLADFAGWHPTITKIIEQAPEHYRWALFDRAPLTQWSDGRVVLLGDAAHPMLPFMAQGAAMAIEDAWVLALQLQQYHDVLRAVDRYVTVRQPRSSKVQAASRANRKTFHHQNPAAYLPIWAAARLLPTLLYKRLDWLYGEHVKSLNK